MWFRKVQVLAIDFDWLFHFVCEVIAYYITLIYYGSSRDHELNATWPS